MESTIAQNNTPKADHNVSVTHDNAKLLLIYSSYRVILSCSLLLIYFFKLGKNLHPVHGIDPFKVLVTYFLWNTACLMYLGKYKSFIRTQLVTQATSDIIFISLLTHISSASSGYSLLLIPVIAAICIITPGRISFFYTAFASTALIIEQLIAHFMYFNPNTNFTLTGITGVSLFGIAGSFNFLTRILKKSQDIRKEQEVKLEELALINEQIVNKLNLGVVVINHNMEIQLFNAAAAKLLQHTLSNDMALMNTMPKLYSTLNNRDSTSFIRFNGEKDNSNLLLHFKETSFDNKKATIIYIENLELQEKRSQEMKLVSLGRLTASIAHEIRNPIGAISHATQLLTKKSSPLNEEKLFSIIQTNVKRTNDIIENILMLGKHKDFKRENIELYTWLKKFVQQFILLESAITPTFDISVSPKTLKVLINQSQFYQIISNICENGIQAAAEYCKEAHIQFVASTNSNGNIYLDIIDNGPGINKKDHKYIFEPFYTNNPQGHGLGLFIARELCLANYSTIEYNNNGISKFRIEFTQSGNS